MKKHHFLQKGALIATFGALAASTLAGCGGAAPLGPPSQAYKDAAETTLSQQGLGNLSYTGYEIASSFGGTYRLEYNATSSDGYKQDVWVQCTPNSIDMHSNIACGVVKQIKQN